jgi:hypothetical protein
MTSKKPKGRMEVKKQTAAIGQQKSHIPAATVGKLFLGRADEPTGNNARAIRLEGASNPKVKGAVDK